MEKEMTPKQKNLERRNRHIVQRINELHNAQSYRLDYCLKQVADEFYVEISTIETILRQSRPKKKTKDEIHPV